MSERSRPTQTSYIKREAIITKKTLSLLLAFLLGISVCAFAVSAGSTAVNGANWMSTIDGSVPITEINIPGTHDSMTRYIPASIISRTQTMSVSEQLYSGVRYLDIRANIIGGELVGVHSFLSCKESYGLFSNALSVKSVVEECKKFLSENNGETVLFLFKHENTEAEQEVFSRFYDECIEPDTDAWFLENRVPDLGEARGKIVLLRYSEADRTRFNDKNSGLNFESYPYLDADDSDFFPYRSIYSYDESTAIAYMHIQDSFKLEESKKIEAIKGFFDSPHFFHDFEICCTNTTKSKPAYVSSRQINDFLMSYDFVAGKVYGIISVDFATKELCEKIYMTNEPLMTNAPAESRVPSFTESYGFLGKLFETIRDFILKLLVIFSN